jgi:hypothetical protein
MTQVGDIRPHVEEAVMAIVTASLGVAVEALHISVDETRIIIRGAVPSYAEKSAAEASLRLAGYSDIDNCLRVVPSLAI